MGITLYIERPRSQPAIELNEWLSSIEADAVLRQRVAPYTVVNPTTGDVIEMPTGEADSEIRIDSEWTSFLIFRRGALAMNYIKDLDDPRNLQRRKIAAIARALNAQIFTDVEDAPLDW